MDCSIVSDGSISSTTNTNTFTGALQIPIFPSYICQFCKRGFYKPKDFVAHKKRQHLADLQKIVQRHCQEAKLKEKAEISPRTPARTEPEPKRMPIKIRLRRIQKPADSDSNNEDDDEISNFESLQLREMEMETETESGTELESQRFDPELKSTAEMDHMTKRKNKTFCYAVIHDHDSALKNCDDNDNDGETAVAFSEVTCSMMDEKREEKVAATDQKIARTEVPMVDRMRKTFICKYCFRNFTWRGYHRYHEKYCGEARMKSFHCN